MVDMAGVSKRTNSAVLSVRCDRRTLATLALYYHDAGVPIRSFSHLVSETLEAMRQIVVNSGKVGDVLSTEDADSVLEDIGKASLNPGGRQQRTYIEQLELEDRFLEGRGTEKPSRVTKKMVDLEAKDTKQAIAEALRRRAAIDKTTKEQLRTPPNVVVEEEKDETPT